MQRQTGGLTQTERNKEEKTLQSERGTVRHERSLGTARGQEEKGKVPGVRAEMGRGLGSSGKDMVGIERSLAGGRPSLFAWG